MTLKYIFMIQISKKTVAVLFLDFAKLLDTAVAVQLIIKNY